LIFQQTDQTYWRIAQLTYLSIIWSKYGQLPSPKLQLIYTMLHELLRTCHMHSTVLNYNFLQKKKEKKEKEKKKLIVCQNC
jgi:hypothetical protein